MLSQSNPPILNIISPSYSSPFPLTFYSSQHRVRSVLCWVFHSGYDDVDCEFSNFRHQTRLEGVVVAVFHGVFHCYFSEDEIHSVRIVWAMTIISAINHLTGEIKFLAHIWIVLFWMIIMSWMEFTVSALGWMKTSLAGSTKSCRYFLKKTIYIAYIPAIIPTSQVKISSTMIKSWKHSRE